jgi:acyl-CoA dehydrogenase
MDFTFSDEQMRLRTSVGEFALEELAPIADEVDASYELVWDAMDRIKRSGLLAYVVPKEYGGKGISSVEICIIREELSQVCVFADEAVVMQGLGGYPIAKFGNASQKQRYLPPLADGTKLINFCLTEPAAGSDVAGIQSTARLEGEAYILNGQKCYVSKPKEIDLSVVFAKTQPDLGSKGISGFLVEKRVSDYQIKTDRLIFECPIGTISMRDMRVPRENLLGEEGQGMRIALGNLDIFRPTVGACALGIARAALKLAIDRARNRAMFGRHLIDFQVTQFKLAEMKAEIDAAALLVYRAAWLADNVARKSTMESSIAKFFSTEMAQRVVDQSLQMHGGMGLNKRSRIELLYRAVRAPRIYEGASEVQLHVIGREILRTPSPGRTEWV